MIDGFHRVEKVIHSDKELIDLISEEIEKPINEKKPLEQIFDECGIDGGQLLDHRTMDIISNYEFYKNAPHVAFDNKVWFDSVQILNKLEPRLF